MTLIAKECFITLYHADMPTARHFYEDKLGLKVREVTYEWYVGYWVTDEKSLTFSICSNPDEIRQWGANGRGAVIDFLVEDIDKTYEDLMKSGVDFETPPTDYPWGLRHARFKDPAGYTLCITGYAPEARIEE